MHIAFDKLKDVSSQEMNLEMNHISDNFQCNAFHLFLFLKQFCVLSR